jgi:hypothetical protein
MFASFSGGKEMGLRAKWICTCDGCGIEYIREEILTEDNWDGTWEHTKSDWCESWSTDNTAWGPGVPGGWLQIVHDEKTGQHYLFFHSDECYLLWLERQGRYSEIEDFRNAVWVA